jgi:hypothetical protein
MDNDREAVTIAPRGSALLRGANLLDRPMLHLRDPETGDE